MGTILENPTAMKTYIFEENGTVVAKKKENVRGRGRRDEGNSVFLILQVLGQIFLLLKDHV